MTSIIYFIKKKDIEEALIMYVKLNIQGVIKVYGKFIAGVLLGPFQKIFSLKLSPEESRLTDKNRVLTLVF